MIVKKSLLNVDTKYPNTFIHSRIHLHGLFGDYIARLEHKQIT